MKRTVITGTGCVIPSEVKTNRDFTVHDFFSEDKKRIETAPTEVVEKFKQVSWTPQNAMDSQAFLELKHEFCDRKRCTECHIGKTILSAQLLNS